MDDDIDIEEHDVLDHPRIRNIFPDLSIIKTEVPSDSADSYPEMYQDYTKTSIKEEYNENFEDFTDFDETLQHTYVEDEMPPEDIYHFNSKIILGSKPNPTVDQTMEVNDNLDAFVLLDDWGQHLEESPSYCKDCQILFATPNALDAHKMTAHSFLVAVSVNKAKKSTTKGSLNYARKSTTCVTNNEVKRFNVARKSTGNVTNKTVDMSKFCNHCNTTFPDHTSLITHLYELLPSKDFACTQCSEIFKNQNDLIEHTRTHVKVEVNSTKANNNEVKFTCLICKKGFSSYKKAKKHKSREHNKILKYAHTIHKEVHIKPVKLESNLVNAKDVVRKHTKVKVEPNSSSKSSIKTEPNKKNSKVPVLRVKNEKDLNECNDDAMKNTPVPKSVLFQCGKCHVNFLRCFVGIRHFQQCSKFRKVRKKATWQCTICTREFRPIDRHMHKIQHKISGKLRVYKSYNRLYERVLSKCPKCNVCFDELMFKYHRTKGCKQPAYKHCEKCDLLIDKTRFEKHLRKHTVNKYKPKDFIVIEYSFDIEISKSVKKEMTMSGKIKFESDTEENKVKSKTLKSIKIDKTLTIEGNADKIKLYFCKHCNCCSKSGFIPESHKNKKCKNCLVRICDECGLLFSYASWPAHRDLHKTRKLTIHDIEFYEYGTKKAVRPQIPQFPKCVKCKIHFAGKKFVRNHACGEDYETCPICNEMYDSFAYKLHKQFHDYGKGNDGEIMPELIKKYESLQKMWHILYLCHECDVNMDSYDKAVEHCQKHFSKKEREGQKIITCFKCQLNFDDSCWTKHSDLHSRNMTINKKDFCILKYKPTNLFADNWLKLFGTLPQEQARQIVLRSLYSVTRSVKMKLVKDGSPDFTIYCCSKCKISVNADEIDSHVHEIGCSKTFKELCLICDVSFCNFEALREHQKLHIDGISKDEFRIVHFNINSDRRLNKALEIGKKLSKDTLLLKKTREVPISTADSNKLKETKIQIHKDKTEPKSVLYKCNNCNVCLSYKYSRATHHCLADSLQRTCKICKLQFAYQFIAKHIITHKNYPSTYDNIKIIPFDPKNTKTKQKAKEIVPIGDEKERVAKIYKCDCGLHFTSLAMIEKHLAICTRDHRNPEVSCSKCGLLFPTEVLVTHLCKHHSKYTKIVIEKIHKPVEETTIDSVDSSDVSQSLPSEITGKSSPMNKKCDIKLYKCAQCNVYFLTQATCYKHTLKHVPLDPKQYIECKLCSLQFTILSLTRHLKRHHDREFNLEKVLIEEYQPNTEAKTAPKIEIYYAVDRVQSLLVSSSNEND